MLVPLLIGAGVALAAYAVQKDDVSGKPTPDPIVPKPAKKKPAEGETAAQAHARATSERDAFWGEKLKATKAEHKSAITTLKSLLTVGEPKPDPKPKDDDE